MDSTANAASDPVYQEFDPSTEWVREPSADTLMVYLPGFKKDQLKVQITSGNNLKISGARKLNANILSRFRKEIPIQSNYDINEIGAKFEKGILYIRNPKLIVPASPAPESLKQKLDQPKKPQILPEKPMKLEEPSKPLEAPKSESLSQETPKPAKEESSKTEKLMIAEEKEEHEVSKRKVVKKADTSVQENAGKIENVEKLNERNESGLFRFVMEDYKNAISGLVKETTNARNATNIAVAILFGIVLGLYVRNALRSFMKPEN